MNLRIALLSGLIAAVSASAASALDLGVNTHQAGSATTNDQVAAVMKQRNLKTARLDFMSGTNVTNFRDQVQKIRANGGKVEVVLQTSYQWDNSCNQNLSFVEQDAYNQTVTLINPVKDIVHDIELLNEAQLRPEIRAEVAWNTVGTSTTPYEGKPCVATLTSVLRGMSRAVKDMRASSGQPLRVILGTVGRDFGFLTFMQQKGVQFDVVGFHVYPWAQHNSLLSDPWYGTGGPLAQLAKFGRPVRINEFNCGETYDAGYENQAWSPVTETCLKSLDKHLTDLRTQTIVDLESITIYELLDEPNKAPPENRFGLMFDLSRPKNQLFLVTAFAGGNLSAAERYEVTRRGLLTDAEIDAMQQSTPTAPQPAPAPTPTESPSGTSITTTGTLVEASGAKWTVSGGVVYRDGSLAGFTASVTLLLYWNHTIYQQNSAGGWWAWVNNGWQATTDPRAPATSPSDTQAPAVTITSPANGASFSRYTTITAAASATDNVAVKEVRFYLAGALRCVGTSSPYQCPIRLTYRRGWTGTLEAQAVDAVGNIGRSSIQIRTR